MSADGERVGRRNTPAGRSPERITPIFRHLPRGPHSLNQREIAIHQRARIHGAMVEAVVRGGYDQITVRRVIGLAGVSRRSFYELFANRHDCFLKTVQAICERELARARDGRRASCAPAEIVLAEAFGSLASEACLRPAALRFVLCDSLSAGDTGAVLLGEALAACERMLGQTLAAAPGAQLPTGILRALGGALHGMLTTALREPAGSDPQDLTAALMDFTLAQRVPRRAGATDELAGRLRDRARRAAVASAARVLPGAERPDARELLLRSAMRVAARQPVPTLCASEIADDAGVPIDVFLDCFTDPYECLGEALARSGEPLLSVARRAHSVAVDWPQAVRLALAGILGHLAAHPTQTRALALVAHRAGPALRAQSVELDAALGAALLGGAAAPAPRPEAAAGALWHTARQSLLEERLRLLPAISDHIAYALLAPAIGAEDAIEALRGPC